MDRMTIVVVDRRGEIPFLAWSSIFLVAFARTIHSRSVESFAELRYWWGNDGKLVKHFHYAYMLRDAKYRSNSPKNGRSLTKGLQRI